MAYRENQFRTVAMGGYDKNEVTQFIESMEADYRVKLGSIEKILAAAQASRNEAENRLKNQDNQQGQDKMEVQRLTAVVTELSARLKDMQLQLEVKDAELTKTLSEMTLLRTQASVATAELESARKEIQQTRAELEALSARGSGDGPSAEELSELHTRLAEHDAILPILQRENLSLRAKLEILSDNDGEQSIQSVAARAELEKRDSELIAAKEELNALRMQIHGYEDSAGKLSDLEKTAEELQYTARAEAERIIAAAQSESSKIHSDLEQWIQGMNSRYAQAKQDAATSVSRAAAELAKTRSILADLSGDNEDASSPFSQHPALKVINGSGPHTNNGGMRETM